MESRYFLYYVGGRPDGKLLLSLEVQMYKNIIFRHAIHVTKSEKVIQVKEY